MIVIALVNTKGGVGKSTLASALAVRALADKMRVAIVDTDPQESLAKWFERRRQKAGMSAVIAEWPSDGIEELRKSRPQPDVVFIDVPPVNIDLIRNAIENADVALIPVKASAHDLHATQDAIAIARVAKKKHLVVINDAVGNENLPTQALRQMLQMGVPTSSIIVAHRMSYAKAASTGESGPELKDRSAAEDIDGLWEDLLALAKQGGAEHNQKGAVKRLRRGE